MILSMAVVMIPMHIRFVVCGELTIPHLGLIYYCFYKRKIAMRNLGKPSRSDFVQCTLWKAIHKIHGKLCIMHVADIELYLVFLIRHCYLPPVQIDKGPHTAFLTRSRFQTCYKK